MMDLVDLDPAAAAGGCAAATEAAVCCRASWCAFCDWFAKIVSYVHMEDFSGSSCSSRQGWLLMDRL
jgi:hypothetical protein